MMRRFQNLMVSVLTFAMIIILSPAAAQAEWELVKDEDGIQVYTQEKEGSEYREFKATTRINASLENVVLALGDGKSCAQWMPMCKDVKQLKQVSLYEYYTYSVVDFPWPLDDRDVVVHSVYSQDPKTKTVTIKMESVSDYYAEQGLIRLETNGYYFITPLEDGTVEFTWQNHSNPGGGISAWMVNSNLADTPYNDLKGLKEMLQEQKS